MGMMLHRRREEQKKAKEAPKEVVKTPEKKPRKTKK